MSKNVWIVGVLVLALGLIAGYFYGSYQAYNRGYDKAVSDTKAAQETLAKKAVEEAAKAANPFQTANPLEGVTANPFDKAKSVLNPFAK